MLHPEDCSPEQVFDPTKCLCSCAKSLNSAKYLCALNPKKIWDKNKCSCVCKTSCLPHFQLDPSSCTCIPANSATLSCSLDTLSLSRDQTARLATFIGLGALTVLGLTIAAALYFILLRRPHSIYSDLTNNSTLSRADYKITINQGHTSVNDQDMNLITEVEEKTKF